MRFCLVPDEVIELNRYLIGTEINLLDRGKLEASLAAPLQTFGGELLTPSPIRQAVLLLTGLVHAHAFIDGNKRTAWVCFVTYLEQFGMTLAAIPATEVTNFVVSLALHKMSDDEAVDWIVDKLS